MNKLLLKLLLLLLFINGYVSAQRKTLLLEKPIEIKDRIASIYQLLTSIEKEGILLTYSPDQINLNKTFHLPEDIRTVGALLTYILKDQGIEIKVVENKILLVPRKFLALSGIIKERGSREVIANANVTIKGSGIRTTTNAYGFYALKLKPGEYEVIVSYAGLGAANLQVVLEGEDQRRDVLLNTEMNLDDAYISVESRKINALAIRGKQIDLECGKEFSSVMGGLDAIGALQTLPGVFGATTNTVGFQVRGGSSDQNMILIDDIPVYSLSHYYGLFSIISPEVLKGITFFSSNFPSRYSGRLSSVADIRTRDGDMNKYNGQLSAGIFQASGNIEGPIIKGKSSFILNARRSWQDLLSNKLNQQLGFKYYFSDINLKVNYIPNQNNRFYLTAYTGKDYFNTVIDQEISTQEYRNKYRWGNKLIAFRWNNILSPLTFLNTTLTISRYRTETDAEYKINEALTNVMSSGLQEYGLKTDFSYYLKPDNKLSYGIGFNLTRFSGQNITARPEMLGTTAYVESDISLKKGYKIVAGLNYSTAFTYDHNYHSFQPRLSLSRQFNSKHLISASFSKMTQFLHQLTQAVIALPTEIRIPSSAAIKPENSYTLNLLYRYSPSNTRSFSFEAYRKISNNLVLLKPGQDFFSGFIADDPINAFLQGRGNNKGLEFHYKEQLKWLDIQFAYALTSAQLHFDQLNSSSPFPANEAGRHNLNITLGARLNKKISFSGAFAFASGQKITVPVQLYKNLDEAMGIYSSGLIHSYQIGGVNSFTLPNEYRVDIGFAHKKTFKNGNQRLWSAGINGLFSRSRSQYIYQTANVFLGEINVERYGLEGIIPYINLTYKFR